MHVRIHTRQVVRQQHRMSSSVEDLCDRLEALLSCCVPNLQLEGQVLHTNQKGTELYADRNFMILCELIVAHPVHQT